MTSKVSPKLEKAPLAYVNEQYLADTEYVVRVAKTLLMPIGIWPRYGDNSTLSNAIIYIRVCLIFCLMLFLLTPHFIWTWFKAEDLRKLMKIIAAQVFSSLAVLKFWTLILNKQDIRYCLEIMENDYRVVESEEDRQIMLKNAKIGRFFTTAYLGLSYGGALPYHIIMPLLQPRVLRSDNTTMIPLPYPSEYVFFIVEDSPLYEIVFVTQILISSIILSTNTGVYSLIACVVMHCCCLFEVTSNRAEKLLRGMKYDKSKISPELGKKLSELIDFHVKAIQYAETMENALNIVMLSEMGGCTIIICFLEYGILQDLEDREYLGMVTYIMLMTSIFVNVFILSYVGDKVKEQSEAIGFSAYSMQWVDLPNEFIMKDLKFVMARANQPTRLTAGKLFDLSLQGFCDVAKTSMAYLNFLRTLEIT
ncbi:odorant receptor 2 [Nasonia vitripennis]|uniref:Odorant receptor n=1 Tax=Nasonia vitripennis TaxID=7425 RepID=A0A7M6USB2_NASVI|nr:odorant receptor 2 [Nasonia vitripennis]